LTVYEPFPILTTDQRDAGLNYGDEATARAPSPAKSSSRFILIFLVTVFNHGRAKVKTDVDFTNWHGLKTKQKRSVKICEIRVKSFPPIWVYLCPSVVKLIAAFLR